MEFIEIKKKEILDFIKTDLYLNSRNIPITEERAISQTRNPRAEDEDILLIIAVNDTQDIVGYIGALPERLSDYPEYKLAWNSCWWTEKGQPSTVSLKLLFKFFGAYNYNVMMRDLTPTTKKIILSFNKFDVFKELKAHKFFFKLKFANKFKKLSFLLKPIDGLFNLFMSMNLSLCFMQKIKDFEISYPTKFEEEDRIFILKHNQKELFKRNIEELNWIIKNPWLSEGKEKNSIQEKYYFSSVKKSFSNSIIKIKKSKEIVGLLFITEINGLLEIPYIYFDKKNINIVGQTILNQIIVNKITSFMTFNLEVANWFYSNKRSFFFSKEINKEFVSSKNLKQYFDKEFDFQDGDGDFVFA